MVCLLFYDVKNDKTRTQIAQKLIESGLERIQLSVFIGPIRSKDFDLLWTEITDILGKQNNLDDKINAVFLRNSQVKAMRCFGPVPDKAYICGEVHSLIL